MLYDASWVRKSDLLALLEVDVVIESINHLVLLLEAKISNINVFTYATGRAILLASNNNVINLIEHPITCIPDKNWCSVLYVFQLHHAAWIMSCIAKVHPYKNVYCLPSSKSDNLTFN